MVEYAPTFYQSLISKDILQLKETIDKTSDQLCLGLEENIEAIIEFLEALFAD